MSMPIEERTRNVLKDPGTPEWAKEVIRLALDRDPVDAASVLGHLSDLFNDRRDAILHRDNPISWEDADKLHAILYSDPTLTWEAAYKKLMSEAEKFYIVEWYDPVPQKWGTRTFTAKAKAYVYAENLFDLLKDEGDEHPNVSVLHPTKTGQQYFRIWKVRR